MGRSRTTPSAAFQAQIALIALQERETLAELSKRFEVYRTMISKWKQKFVARPSEIIASKAPKDAFNEGSHMMAYVEQYHKRFGC